jgi:hypothetical protein
MVYTVAKILLFSRVVAVELSTYRLYYIDDVMKHM